MIRRAGALLFIAKILAWASRPSPIASPAVTPWPFPIRLIPTEASERRMAMIAITAKSSTKLKPFRKLRSSRFGPVLEVDVFNIFLTMDRLFPDRDQEQKCSYTVYIS
jgi:hypothetical protein